MILSTVTYFYEILCASDLDYLNNVGDPFVDIRKRPGAQVPSG